MGRRQVVTRRPINSTPDLSDHDYLLQTTTFNLISGIYAPNSGEIPIDAEAEGLILTQCPKGRRLA